MVGRRSYGGVILCGEHNKRVLPFSRILYIGTKIYKVYSFAPTLRRRCDLSMCPPTKDASLLFDYRLTTGTMSVRARLWERVNWDVGTWEVPPNAPQTQFLSVFCSVSGAHPQDIFSVYTGILFSKNCFKVKKFDKIYFFVL